MVRLNKFIAESGVLSRRKADELISQGRIEVNDKIIMELGFQIDPDNDVVTVDGEKIKRKKLVYYVLNKPKGFITSTDDEKGRKTVVELIKTKERVFPVGRLDYNTTGVLVITNDGEFCNLLTHPSNHVPREYKAKLSKQLTLEDEQKLLKGIYIDNVKGKFESIKVLKNHPSGAIVEIKCTEGRNHFVKNMFGAIGYRVTDLDRLSFGGIKSNISVGEYRILTDSEIKTIYKKYASKK